MAQALNMDTLVSMSSSLTALRIRLLLKPIVIGGLIAGSLDLISAFITFGWGIPRLIAAGLLGRQALHGGSGIWVLGVFLQYFIACSAAAIYCLASLKLDFLKSSFVICGMFYGIAIFLVMSFIVLPLSAIHSTGPYHLHSLIQGLLTHMLIIGLPIAFSLHVFSKSKGYAKTPSARLPAS
jgi:hypothetical protein